MFTIYLLLNLLLPINVVFADESRNENHSEIHSEIRDDSASPLVQKIIRKSSLKASMVGYTLKDLETGKLIDQHQPALPFIPASTLKIITASYALETLGGSAVFKTQLLKKGEIKSGAFKGDLILVGGGDPLLTAAKLFDLALKLKKLGIKSVEGTLYGDESLYPFAKIIDSNGEQDQSFNPGISALSSEFNRFVYWRNGPKRRTSKSEFRAIPAVANLDLIKTSRKFDPGIRYEWKSDENHDTWIFSTSQNYPRREELPVRNPARFTAELFKYLLTKAGITTPKLLVKVVSKAEEAKTIKSGSDFVADLTSPPLSDLVESALEYSNNVISELILLAAAKKDKPTIASQIEASEQMAAWTRSKLKVKDDLQVKFVNGSGLSGSNQISPAVMTDLLQTVAEKEYDGRSFWSLLSISGWKGWIKNRLSDPNHAFRVWAKTGSMDYAITLCGIINGQKNNRALAFSIFVNDFDRRRELESLGDTKKSVKLRRAAMSWREKAQSLQDDIISHWVSIY